MINQQEPGIVTILKALRAAVDAIPNQGEKIDWDSLNLKKNIAKKAMAKLEEIFATEPLKTQGEKCDDWWPKIW